MLWQNKAYCYFGVYFLLQLFLFTCFGFMTGYTDNHNNCVIQFSSAFVRMEIFLLVAQT